MSANTGAQPESPQRPTVIYRRRTFLIKHGFQLRFAAIPLLFLVLFLVAGWVYLYDYLTETFEYYLYLPHCSLENPWMEVWPGILRVVSVGGGLFLLVLGLWVWRRFARLHAELNLLEKWPEGVLAARGQDALKEFKDPEVKALAGKLLDASDRFAKWDDEAKTARREFEEAVQAVLEAPDSEVVAGIAKARSKWVRLWDKAREVRVDEALS